MKTIKNLEQAYRYAGNQITAQDLINGRMYHKLKGWVNVKLTPEFEAEIAEQLSELYGGIRRTKAQVFRTLLYSRPQHWGLSRTMLVKYNKQPARWDYCAGQDYPSEMNIIRTALK